MADINCIKPTLCVPEQVEPDIYPPATPEFSFCAGNQTIHWDGARLTVATTGDIADGEYGTVTVENGCVVGYGQALAPTYTPAYCNPNPAPCSDGSSGGSSYSISPAAGNIIVDSSLGIYAKSYVQGSTGITVTGVGTEANPYKISASVGSGVTKITSDNTHININNTITNAPSIGINDSGITAGTYAGFTIDRFGFVTAYSDDSDDVVGEIRAGADITVSNIGGTYTVGHTTTQAGNTTVRLGAFDVQLSAGGHVVSTTRQTTTVAGIYAVDGWLITIDTYGAITNITEDTTVVPESSDAIIDIIELVYNSPSNTYTIQGLGASQPTNAGGNGDAYSFTMPPNVIDVSQVTTIGGGGLSVSLIDTVPVKVQMTSFTTSGANVKFVIRGT